MEGCKHRWSRIRPPRQPNYAARLATLKGHVMLMTHCRRCGVLAAVKLTLEGRRAEIWVLEQGGGQYGR